LVELSRAGEGVSNSGAARRQLGLASSSSTKPDLQKLGARLVAVEEKTENSQTMREIVHLQAGQCGNQIGAKVSIDYYAIRFELHFT